MDPFISKKVGIEIYFVPAFVFAAGSLVLLGLVLDEIGGFVIGSSQIFSAQFKGYLIMFPFMFSLAMWFIFGYEQVEINKQNLVLRKSNRLFSRRHTIPLSKLTYIGINRNARRPKSGLRRKTNYIKESQRALALWSNMGQLKCTTTTTSYTFFNGLMDQEEVSTTLEVLKKELNKRLKGPFPDHPLINP